MEKKGATIKVDTTENWKKAKNYIPDVFTIIIYQDDNKAPKIKIGDGVTPVDKLPFLANREVKDSILVL